jgi:hypothetical protein
MGGVLFAGKNSHLKIVKKVLGELGTHTILTETRRTIILVIVFVYVSIILIVIWQPIVVIFYLIVFFLEAGLSYRVKI